MYFPNQIFYHSALWPLFQVRLWRNLWSYTGLSQSCPYSHWSGRKKRYQSDPISSLWVERSFQAQQFIQGSIHLQRYIFTFTYLQIWAPTAPNTYTRPLVEWELVRGVELYHVWQWSHFIPFTVNRNGISATKTVWHEILLRHMIFAYHWTS